MEPRYARLIASSVLTAVALVGLAATSADGQCTEPKEASTLKKSIRRATKCNDKSLRSGTDVTCRETDPPPCAGTLPVDAVKLGYGQNNPPAGEVDHRLLSDQLKCQKRIGRALVHYI